MTANESAEMCRAPDIKSLLCRGIPDSEAPEFWIDEGDKDNYAADVVAAWLEH